MGDLSKKNSSKPTQKTSSKILKNSNLSKQTELLRVQKLIDEGKYKVHPEEIAEKLLEEPSLFSEL